MSTGVEGDVAKMEVGGGQVVTPWSVQADSNTGIDYDKLIGKHVMGRMMQFSASDPYSWILSTGMTYPETSWTNMQGIRPLVGRRGKFIHKPLMRRS